MNIQETKVLIDTGSLNRKKPKSSINEKNFCSLTQLINNYNGVDKNVVTFESKKIVTIGNGRNRMQLLVILSNCEGLTPLLRQNGFDGLLFDLRTYRIASIITDNQLENEVMRRLQNKCRRISPFNQATECVEVKIFLEANTTDPPKS